VYYSVYERAPPMWVWTLATGNAHRDLMLQYVTRGGGEGADRPGQIYKE